MANHRPEKPSPWLLWSPYTPFMGSRMQRDLFERSPVCKIAYLLSFAPSLSQTPSEVLLWEVHLGAPWSGLSLPDADAIRAQAPSFPLRKQFKIRKIPIYCIFGDAKFTWSFFSPRAIQPLMDSYINSANTCSRHLACKALSCVQERQLPAPGSCKAGKGHSGGRARGEVRNQRAGTEVSPPREGVVPDEASQAEGLAGSRTPHWDQKTAPALTSILCV